MEKKQILAEYTVVATLSAAVVIATLNCINALIPQLSLPESSAWVIRLLAATGTYFLFFRITIWFYFKTIWQFVHRKKYLNGQWRYTYNRSYNATTGRWDPAADSSGKAQIEHTVEDIKIDGVSHSMDSNNGETSLIAEWTTSATSLHGNTLDASITITTGSGTENGIARLQIVTEPPIFFGTIPVLPKSLKGHYFTIPSNGQAKNYGRVEFSRL